MHIVYVPTAHFYTAVTLSDGSTTWGYEKEESASNINFMLIHPSVIVQGQKFAIPKIFTPDENQEKDAWKFQFRLYHDAFVYDTA